MRIYVPAETIDTSLIDYLPKGHAFYTRTKGAPGPWAVMIGDTIIANDMDKSVALWVSDQINAARHDTERTERLLLQQLSEKYGLESAK